MSDGADVVVVTGAGRGIGRVIALHFARAGARLVLAARSAAELDETHALAADLGAEAIVVQLDRARLIKVPERAATIVIGNPLIADVSVQPGGIAVITGKGYGATNFIALDRTGQVLVDRQIQVEGPPSDQLVTVYRGIDRETYSCMPVCQRRITLGDGETYFKSTMDQAGTLNSQASGSASAAKPTN